jgi:hypothetical protein
MAVARRGGRLLGAGWPLLSVGEGCSALDGRCSAWVKFPTEKYFCSWLGLTPKHDISGSKVLKNRTIQTHNRAGQVFHMAAQSVKKVDNRFGAMYQRLRARLEPAQATVATAHAIARVVYKMLKYKVAYDPLSVNEYQQQYEAQQVKYMKKKAAKFSYQLVPV